MALKKNNFIISKNINKRNFKPFGDLIEKPLFGNRSDFVAKIQKTSKVNKQSISVISLKPSKPPLSIDIFERHKHTSQTFFPLDVQRYLIVVAPDLDNKPDLEKIRAFIVPGTIAINYYIGTWHCPLQVLDRSGTFAILMYLFDSELDQQWSNINKVLIRVN